MPDYTYSPAPVLVEATGEFAIGATGVLRSAAGGNAVQVYDLNGSPLPNITVGPKGACQAFKADIPDGILDFGSVLLPAISQESLTAALSTQQAAEDAAASADTAAASAAQAAASADTAAAAAVGKADLIGGTVPEAQLPIRLSDVELRAALVSVNEAPLNPARYGDLSTGQDVTAAFQVALNAAAAAGGGHVLVPPVPAGSFHKVTQNLVWPSGVGLVGVGEASLIELQSAALTATDTSYLIGRDFTIRRTGSAGPALSCSGSTAGVRRNYFDNVHISASTGNGAEFSGGWITTWANPIIHSCAGMGLLITEGAFSTGMNGFNLLGGEVQGNDIGLMLDKCKAVALYGTSVEGNRIGLGVGDAVEALLIDGGHWEGNTGGHIIGTSYNGGTAGLAAAVTVKAGTYFLRGTGGPDRAIDLANVRQFIVEDGVSLRGYASATAAVISVADVGDSVRAGGYVGQIRTDAPESLVLANNCYFFGRRTDRRFPQSTLLGNAATTIVQFPLGLHPTRRRNCSTKMTVNVYLNLTGAAGNIVLSARGRDTAGVTVGTQVNQTPAVTAGYNRVSFTLGDSENIAYLEVFRTGGDASDTAGDATLTGIEAISYENRVLQTTLGPA